MDIEQQNQQNVPVSVPPQNPPQNSSYNLKSSMAVGMIVLLIASYFFGYQMGHKGFVYDPKSFKIVNQNQQPQTVDYSLLWDALNVINTKYIDQPIDQQKVLYGAISGAVAAVGDPYTTFFTPTTLTN